MSEETLQEIIERKNEEIENLKDKNKILFKQLYKAKEELGHLKSIIREHVENPDDVLDEDGSE